VEKTNNITFVIDKSYYTRIRHGKLEHVHDNRVRKTPEKNSDLRITIKELNRALTKGTVGIISAGRNTNSEKDLQLTEEEIEKRYADLENKLLKDGRAFIRAKGVWEGGEERSYIVAIPNKDRSYLIKLGVKYNQDSVIFVNEGRNEYIYCTGPNKGQCHIGKKFEEVAADIPSGYTEIDAVGASPYKFALDFDFDNTKPVRKSYVVEMIAKSDYVRVRNGRLEYVHDTRVAHPVERRSAESEIEFDTQLKVWDMELENLTRKEHAVDFMDAQSLIEISKKKADIYTAMIAALEPRVSKIEDKPRYDFDMRDTLLHEIKIPPKLLTVKGAD